MVSAVLASLLALTDCTVIDPRTGAATASRSVVIRDDRIAAVGPAASTRIPPGSRIVRAAGKFVIPGLWDMHVHVGEIEEDWFPLYLANGLTGLRELAASEKNVPRQRQYQEELAAGRRVGPELFWTHFSMDAPAIGDERQPAPKWRAGPRWARDISRSTTAYRAQRTSRSPTSAASGVSKW
jgi:predicted amidohydrolase YtcJ